MTESTEPRYEHPPTAGRARGVMSELSRETDREILEILVANSPLQVLDIAKTADRHPVTVDQTCARLHEQGQIHPVEDSMTSRKMENDESGRTQIRNLEDMIADLNWIRSL